MEKTVSQIDYLGMSGWGKFCYRARLFFRGLPAAFLSIFTVLIPKLARKVWGAVKGFFLTLYNAMAKGDWKTRMSFAVMGTSQFARKQVMRGIMFLAFEILFILYMVVFGGAQLSLFGTIGRRAVVESETVSDFLTGDDIRFEKIPGDDSRLVLLYGILTMIFIVAFVYAWYANIKSGFAAQQLEEAKQHLPTAKEDFKTLADAQYHKTLLVGPLIGLVIFTIFPIIFMIFLAFTNYDVNHMAPDKLFTWVGWKNFQALFAGGLSGSGGARFGVVFGKLLLWTVIWAIFATFTNYILGMIVAIIINKKGIRFKKLWRTILIMTIAVPQFVSLLLMSKMLADGQLGIINVLLGTNIKWLTDPTLAKFTVILVNIWVGIPFTMLMVTGILMNIPADLYESARIDGAGPVRMYFKITLPYVLHVTAPSLISNFVGNLNNFGVIYLLSGGGPNMSMSGSGGAGETDLLITWLYKLINDKKQYGMASVISILMFLLTAIISLVVYNRSKAVKNEEDFM